MQMPIVQYRYIGSPLGPILLMGVNDVLHSLRFASQAPIKTQHTPKAFAVAAKQLEEYFAGQRSQFTLDYHLEVSPFQKQVLNCVAQIPFGVTSSYSEIAQKINNPRAVRAVGGANATNPLPIIIPCHRVIGKNGHLTGFAAGLEVKSYLLGLENVAQL